MTVAEASGLKKVILNHTELENPKKNRSITAIINKNLSEGLTLGSMLSIANAAKSHNKA